MAEVVSTFIVRLWTVQEPGVADAPRGRGRIDHVQSGEHAYFEQLSDGLEFLRQRFGAFDSLQTADGAGSTSSPERGLGEPSPITEEENG
jgi:hypothetical protein